ncbi:TonB-dependent receptor [Subsaximicrobium wynnwilliamsii]|uniref:TonB-dependent receptor n=1 Tax=Subsaximicrobium wynnwilliamsii TaxID=291179 RepID=A0A5C6ZCF1_9FLAO|nr:TonB-dependent receptor [Subsaximicrobium wynnwilliamsii]TXD81982.1 TonB-dependent receptor [Subsaximicrobium wynnwilliamsii]TXD87680.1 TonB-dependent receptor [Subsaximicrobium wynnwilliamsii]TXE01426.1 TonB-dependent receptor [Subsaximicrobium wynnwilliamsii]
MKTKIVLFLMLLFGGFVMFAQDMAITGTVTTAQDDMPLPGVNVLVKGTSRGAYTDFDGKYTITASPGDVLQFSAIGLKSQSVTVANTTVINVALEEDAQALDEVVVIGYGTQKKIDLVGAITTVESEDIEKTPNSNVMQSLQGKVAGLQIVSNGAPGASPTVRLRGVNSFAGGDNPLYVVDGQWYDNIDFLDSSQIETISVLKDVSSIAIFGQRGVNGVIIVETKSGKLEQKASITYSGYTGVQNAQNVVKMANAEQFVTMAYESESAADIEFVENSIARFGRSRVNPNLPDVNTDWYKEILRPASITNHSIGVNGGSASTTYGVNASFFSQEGVLDMKNEYERFNIQSNIDVNVTNRLKVGTNSIFSNATQYNPENAAFFSAYFAVPTLPVFDFVNPEATSTPYSDAQFLDYRGSQNPFPVMDYNENQLKIRKILTSIYAEYQIVPDKLTFKTSYYHDYSTISERNVRLPYYISGNSNREQVETSIRRAESIYSFQQWDNTLTFTDSYGDHDLTVLAGSTFQDSQRNFFNATGSDVQGIALESSWYLNFADPTSFNDNVKEIGDRFYTLAYFGRLEYKFKDRYLLNATIRTEGDAKFPSEIWKTTAQFGLGWVISEEGFMEDNGIFDFLKLRGSWGQLANGALGGSAGSRTIDQVTLSIRDLLTNGIISSNNFTDLKREVLEETNIGISSRLFNNRLSLEADYYIRDTKDLVIPVQQPIVGNALLKNVGEMRNEGLEVALNWSESISDNWSYSIGGNIATLENSVTKINTVQGYLDTGSPEFLQRLIVGEPVNAFFGYEVAGVYQNDAQVANDPIAVDNNLVPGDLIYVDINNDGVIDDADRKVIGSYLPSFTYGGNFSVSYKNFDLSVAIAGQTGYQILNRKRGEVLFTNDTNIDAEYAINRWHGEGTSNTYPSSAGRRRAWNQKMSTFFVEDGDYFRIQNIQLAYTIPASSLIGKNMPETRFTFTAERPFTSFDYNGFTPEVPNGIDRQTYPIPAVYTVGVNIRI